MSSEKQDFAEVVEELTDAGYAVLAVPPGNQEERDEMDHNMKDFIRKNREKLNKEQGQYSK